MYNVIKKRNKLFSKKLHQTITIHFVRNYDLKILDEVFYKNVLSYFKSHKIEIDFQND